MCVFDQTSASTAGTGCGAQKCQSLIYVAKTHPSQLPNVIIFFTCRFYNASLNKNLLALTWNTIRINLLLLTGRKNTVISIFFNFHVATHNPA